MRSISIRVVDPEGEPIPGATVIPWALQSAQGHGQWGGDKDRAKVQPSPSTTDDTGLATIDYPYFRDVEEGTRTIGVSIFVDHREYAFSDAIHIDVPLEEDSPFEVNLKAGAPVELRPTMDGKPVDTDDLFAFWSDGRSWQPNDSLERSPHNTLRLSPLKPGSHSVLVAKLDGDHVTHLSAIVDFDVTSSDHLALDVPLQPAQRIEGVLAEDVPRPIMNGRIKVATLNPTDENHNRVRWFSWFPIRPDGSFTIDAWPTGESIQLIALCDGFIGASGKAPAAVANPPDPAKDYFLRPQVFATTDPQPITVSMVELVQCNVVTVDEDDKPVAEVSVWSWPNVGWWNGGAQGYGTPLVRAERLLRNRDYVSSTDNDFPHPFQAKSDGNGCATLQLPEGHYRLGAFSELYELPVFLGQRHVAVAVKRGEASDVTLRLQAKGTDKLGEWDKLAGVVFGCSTREGRQICALPEVRAKMEEFTAKFRDSKNQRDPKLLSEAYALVAQAFVNANDLDEAVKWQKKANEQAALAAGDEN